MNHISETFCSYFWSHVCIRPENRLVPCCRFQGDVNLKVLSKEDLELNLNSNDFQNFRKQSLSGEPISGCAKCYEQEKSGIISLRQMANQKMPLQKKYRPLCQIFAI